MKRTACFLLMLLACLSLTVGCAAQPSKQDAIPFAEGQYYAAAYLGYQEMTDLDAYAQQYLDSDQLPVFHLSDGDYYLIIPRYEGMELSLYRNDLETGAPSLVYEDPDCGPFILQCNVSDIFADATVELRYEDETVTFSPFISLKDGSVDIGPQGLLLTK
jgi:hypothetical protein